VDEFLEAHELNYVVEQNRDGQLRSLIQMETGMAGDRLHSVLSYGGFPLSAETVVNEITAWEKR
jgi:2-oxoglutarate ferredoxin oxidoreductase subunit alpha